MEKLLGVNRVFWTMDNGERGLAQLIGGPWPPVPLLRPHS